MARSDPSERPLRLFVAVTLPAQALDAVEVAMAPWSGSLAGARATPRDQRHVTLRFLGATRPDLLEWVEDRLGDVGRLSAPFVARLSGLGAFPSLRRARVVWAGVDDAIGGFAGLAGLVTDALAPELASESRPFTPHLTVARADPPLTLPPAIGEAGPIGESFPVDRIVLFRSHLGGRGARHEALEEFPLTGGG